MFLKHELILVFFILFSFVVLPVSAKEESKMIMYIQSEPGAFTTSTFIKTKDICIASIEGYGRSTIKEEQALAVEYFDNLWSLASSEEFEAYVFEPSEEDNMADPNFHNVTLSLGKKRTNIRIPKDENITALSQLIDMLTNWKGDS